MLPTTLLLSLLTEAAPERRRRGRVRELQQRLGLGLPPATARGRAARVRWVQATWPRIDLARLESLLRRAGLPAGAAPGPDDALVPWFGREVWRLQSADARAAGCAEVESDTDALRQVRHWALAATPDLGRYTLAAAAAEAREWHAELASRTSRHHGERVPPGTVVYSWPDGWTVHELDQLAQADGVLQAEGRSMGNCLAEDGYSREISDGSIVVYSMRGPPGPEGWSRPVVTMALQVTENDIESVDGHEQRLGEFFAEEPDEERWALEPHEDIWTPEPEVERWSLVPPEQRVDLARTMLLKNDYLRTSFLDWLQRQPGSESYAFVEIKGRQNEPPHERYRPRTLEFLRWKAAQLVSGPGAEIRLLTSDPYEIFPLLSEADREWDEVWRGHPTTAIHALSNLVALNPDGAESRIADAWRRIQEMNLPALRYAFVVQVLRHPDPPTAAYLAKLLLRDFENKDLLPPLPSFIVSYCEVDPAASHAFLAMARELHSKAGPGMLRADLAALFSVLVHLRFVTALTDAGWAESVHHLLSHHGEDARFAVIESVTVRIRAYPHPRSSLAVSVDRLGAAGLLPGRPGYDALASRAGLVGSVPDAPAWEVVAAALTPALVPEIRECREMLSQHRWGAAAWAAAWDRAAHPVTARGAVAGDRSMPHGWTQPQVRSATGDLVCPSPLATYAQLMTRIELASCAAVRAMLLTEVARALASGEVPGASPGRAGESRLPADLAAWVLDVDGDAPADDTRAALAANPWTSLQYAVLVDHAPHPVTRAGASGHATAALDYAERVDQVPHPVTRAGASAWPPAALDYAGRVDHGPHPVTAAGVAREISPEERRAAGAEFLADPNRMHVYEYRRLVERPGGCDRVPIDGPTPGRDLVTALTRAADRDERHRAGVAPDTTRQLALMVDSLARASELAARWMQQRSLPLANLHVALQLRNLPQPTLSLLGGDLTCNEPEIWRRLSPAIDLYWTVRAWVRVPTWLLYDRLAGRRDPPAGMLREPWDEAQAVDWSNQLLDLGRRLNVESPILAETIALLRQGASRYFPRSAKHLTRDWVARRAAHETTVVGARGAWRLDISTELGGPWTGEDACPVTLRYRALTQELVGLGLKRGDLPFDLVRATYEMESHTPYHWGPAAGSELLVDEVLARWLDLSDRDRPDLAAARDRVEAALRRAGADIDALLAEGS